MAQAKKKQSTKTAKKCTTCTQARRKTACKTRKSCGVSRQEKMHIYVITAMSLVAGILLCANAAMMMV